MNKLNNIFEYININDCLNSNIIDNYKKDESNEDYILNNSLIISELNNYENSYSLYYRTNESTYLLSYLIQEGNGLYNYETYHSLFFNIDNNSIRESYYKIFTDTNFINLGNDDIYDYGISGIDNSYLINYKNTISVNNELISYFNKIKNRMYDIYEKYKDIYKKISYYNTVSKTYNSNYDYEINYDYKDITIKFIDNYYFTNNILDSKYKDYYITLTNDNNMIYFKNINLLNISLEVKSDFKEKTDLYNSDGTFKYTEDDNEDGINITVPNNTDIYGILSKSEDSIYFPSLSAICNNVEYKGNNPNSKISISYNTICLSNNTELQQKLLKNYGGEISIKIKPDSLSYIDNNHIFNYNYGMVNDNVEMLSVNQYPYTTIIKYIPNIDKIKLSFDNRNITNGVSFYNESIKNSYIMLMDLRVEGDIPITNNKLIEKLLDNSIIWYNYDPILHYGYNISYINTRDNLYRKNYTPIFQNISTKVINFNFLYKYLDSNNLLPNIETIDIGNVVCTDMSSFVFSNTINKKLIYVYKYNPITKIINIVDLEVNNPNNKIIL